MSELDSTQENVVADTTIDEKEPNEGTHIEGEVKPPSKWEASARSAGWVPLEEWEGDPDDWTDAKEFVKRGELFHKISSQSSEIKDLRKAINGLMEHHSKVKETEFTRALEYLKQQKKAALEEGNADKLLAVDDAIDTLKQEQAADTTAKTQSAAKAGPTPTFVGWVQQNQWYMADPELRAFADDVGVGAFQRANGQIDEAELYQLVKQRVMKAFPEKFRATPPKTSAVEGVTSTRPGKNDNFRLTEDEERVMKTFVRSGVMTKDQYIADLKRVKGIS